MKQKLALLGDKQLGGIFAPWQSRIFKCTTLVGSSEVSASEGQIMHEKQLFFEMQIIDKHATKKRRKKEKQQFLVL
jgi:hypothetical protein